MSIEGSINVSALFHDRDGTTAMKVVSLRSSNEYTTGNVAIVTGTVGTTAVIFSPSDAGSPISTYRNAGGELVSLGLVTQILLKCNNNSLSLVGPTFDVQFTQGSTILIPCSVDAGDTFSLSALSGTASYTIVIYGPT